MGQGLFIIGTDTDVGKTFTAAAIVYTLLKEQKKVAYFKPVQSGTQNWDGTQAMLDGDFVGEISGLAPDQRHCGFGLKLPVSPHLAAEFEETSIDGQGLVDQYRQLLTTADYLVVEGAGGIAVPLVRGGLTVGELVCKLDIPALLVARAGVGTINHTVLTVAYAKGLGIRVAGILVNNFSGQIHEVDNIKVIEDMTGIPVIAVLGSVNGQMDTNFTVNCRHTFDRDLPTQKVIALFGE